MNDKKEQLTKRGHEEWLNEDREARWNRRIRWGIGIFFILISPFIGPAWFVALPTGLALIGIDAAGWIGNLFGSVIWRRGKTFGCPNYTVPESKVAHGKYAEAEAEYEKIIKDFPDEAKPHIALIDLAVTRLNDGDIAAKLYERGMNMLGNKKSRETLTRMYNAIKSRLKTTDNTERKTIAYRKTE
jgi:hypothetical protein